MTKSKTRKAINWLYVEEVKFNVLIECPYCFCTFHLPMPDSPLIGDNYNCLKCHSMLELGKRHHD